MAASIASAAPAPLYEVIAQLFAAIDTRDTAAVRDAIQVVEDTPEAHLNLSIEWTVSEDAVTASTTAVLLATLKNLPQVVQLLLEHGADPHLSTGSYRWPLMTAVLRGHIGVAQVLLDSGLVNIDLPDEEGGKSSLSHAVNGPKPLEMALLLITKGANVNRAASNGLTALHWAAWWKLDTMCKWLIDVGADPEAQDGQGKTPREWVPEGSATATLLDPVNLEARRVWRLEQRVSNRSRVLEMIDLFTSRKLQERYLLPIVWGYLGWDKFASLGDDPEWLGIATREEVREWELLQGQGGGASFAASSSSSSGGRISTRTVSQHIEGGGGGGGGGDAEDEAKDEAEDEDEDYRSTSASRKQDQEGRG